MITMDLQTLINTVKVATNVAGLKVSGKNMDKINTMSKTGKTIMTAKNINKINSIKGKARKSIAQYPVLVSENLNPKMVPIITNALEVNYASLLMLVLGSVSSYDSGDTSSVLSKFHNVDGQLGESTFLEGVDSVHAIYEANKDLLVPYEEAFNMSTLNESYYTGQVMEYLSEAGKKNKQKQEKREKAIKNKRDYETHEWKRKDDQRKDIELQLKQNADRRAQQEFKDKQKANAANEERQKVQDTREAEKFASEQRGRNLKDIQAVVGTASQVVNTGINISKEIDRKRDRVKDAERHEWDRERQEWERERQAQDKAQRQHMAGKGTVLTTMKDLNKFNDLHPLILNVEVNFREPEGNAVITKTVSVGVKCVTHLVKSGDIEYYLTKAAYKNSGLLKLIKWTTGEIKFWKDLVFALDDIKMSVLQNAKGSNHFSKLEYVAKMARQSIVAGKKAQEVPNAITTLVITKTDVENIKYRDGVDILSDPNYLKKIFNAYYLLEILIVDEGLDVIYKYNEKNNSIEREPFSSYERASKERVVTQNDLLKLVK